MRTNMENGSYMKRNERNEEPEKRRYIPNYLRPLTGLSHSIHFRS